MESLRKLYFKGLSGLEDDKDLELQIVKQVLAQAKKVIAHPARPLKSEQLLFSEFPQGELLIEESLENSPSLEKPEDLIVERMIEKEWDCVALLDTSSSMSGEKHLIASIAVAVMLLELPPERASVVVFNSNVKTIKKLKTGEYVEQVVLNFLRARPKGFTNLHLGLKEGLKQFRVGRSQKSIALIATDGRATEGGDPLEVAKHFDFLVVLHLKGPGSHLESSLQLAQQGKGICLEVENFGDLPHRLYEALRFLSRRA
jgi:hypothetical protein